MDNPIELARLAYVEHIIRNTDPDPERMEDFLSLDGQVEKARFWLAFAIAKRRYDSDSVRGLLVYIISSYSAKLNRAKQKWLIQRIEEGKLSLSQLTVEMLTGTCLRWGHIFKLVRKEFNPTRERERVKEIYEELCHAAEAKEKIK